MSSTRCSAKFKLKNSSLTASVLIFLATILARTKGNTSLCKQDWVEWNKRCYQITTEGTWNASQTNCEQDGANLASIGSEEEYLFVLSLIKKKSVNNIWIGLNDNENEGQLKWVDESPLVFTNMSRAHVNDEFEDCVQVDAAANPKEWIPHICSDWVKGLCKYVSPSNNDDFSLEENYTRQQLYITEQSKVFLNHVIKKKMVPSLPHCALLCLKETKCRSLSYKSSQNRSHFKNGLCLVNSATADEFPEDFIDNSAYIYALPIK